MKFMSPSFGHLAMTKNNLVYAGDNSVPRGNYQVNGSTNLSLSLANWTRVATNQFDATGSSTFTNLLNPNSSHRFYRLQLP